MSCDHQHIYASPDPCAFVTYHCEASSSIDFNVFYYCTLDQNFALFLPIAVFLLLSSSLAACNPPQLLLLSHHC